MFNVCNKNKYEKIHFVNENELFNKTFVNKTHEQIEIFDFNNLQSFIDCFYENEFQNFFDENEFDFDDEYHTYYEHNYDDKYCDIEFLQIMQKYDKKRIENEFLKIKSKYENNNVIYCVFVNNANYDYNELQKMYFDVFYQKNNDKNIYVDHYVIMYNIDEFVIECVEKRTFKYLYDALSYEFECDKNCCEKIEHFNVNYINCYTLYNFE